MGYENEIHEEEMPRNLKQIQSKSKIADDPPPVNVHISRAVELIQNDRIVFSLNFI